MTRQARNCNIVGFSLLVAAVAAMGRVFIAKKNDVPAAELEVISGFWGRLGMLAFMAGGSLMIGGHILMRRIVAARTESEALDVALFEEIRSVPLSSKFPSAVKFAVSDIDQYAEDFVEGESIVVDVARLDIPRTGHVFLVRESVFPETKSTEQEPSSSSCRFLSVRESKTRQTQSSGYYKVALPETLIGRLKQIYETEESVVESDSIDSDSLYVRSFLNQALTLDIRNGQDVIKIPASVFYAKITDLVKQRPRPQSSPPPQSQPTI